jgi:NADH-quinone oxidoreductase subunit L
MLTPYDPWLVWLVPLLGAIVVPIIGRFAKSDWSKKARDILAVAFSGLAVIFAVSMIPSASPTAYPNIQIPWIPTVGVTANVLVDPLSVFITNIAADIGFLIMLYSIGYMKKEEDMDRYWFFMLFFIGGMILLVMAGNLLQMFIGWEIVGTCSWGLIGYWYKKSKDYDDPWIGQMPEGDYNAHAGMKAFITTRIGDAGLLTAILIIFVYSGTFNYQQLAATTTWAKNLANAGLLIPVALLFFAGPIGKSAQFPLDAWLMEAMAGPTTVSALIHAAAMVKAGIYLVARILPIFFLVEAIVPQVSVFFITVAVIGCFTAFLAATMGTVQREIKKVLACSTISQLGYGFMALGVGGLLTDLGPAFAAGTLLMAIHAIFKALLFLGAGAVIHSVESIYMDEMGGLRKKMPITFICMLVGVLSLSGVPPFAGFFSKDNFLGLLWTAGQTNALIMGIFVMAALTAVFTVFYSFRLIGLTFFGSESKHIKELEHEGHEVHEAPRIMWIPLVILAVFTLFFGFLSPLFEGYITGTLGAGTVGPQISIGLGEFLVDIFTSTTFIITIIIIIVGFVPTYFLYFRRSMSAEKLTRKGSVLGKIRTFFFNRWYINAFYYKVFVNGFLSLTKKIRGTVEEKGIDRFNYASARGFGRISNALRKIHTGILTVNLIYIVAGALIFILILILA